MKILKLEYKINLNLNKWKEAIANLDQLAEFSKESGEGGAEESDFKMDKILSEKAWIMYSFVDSIVDSEEERKQLMVSSAKMLVDAIEANAKNVEARTRLGTLIHVFGSSYLKDLDIPQK